MSEGLIAVILAAASATIQLGILLATVKALKQDVNGIGKKVRSIMAEQIIQAAPPEARKSPDFAVTVRKIINGI